MRLLIVGSLGGHIATAGKIALDGGAKVAHVDDVAAALKALRAGQIAEARSLESRRLRLSGMWLVNDSGR